MSFNPYEEWSEESHQDELRSELIAYKAMRSVLSEEKASLLAERDALRAELDEERAIVDRIWSQFGTPSYESLKGRTIYDLIEEVKAERDALRAVLREIVHEYDQTYDCDGDTTGSWKGAASIPVEVMQRAARLVGGAA